MSISKVNLFGLNENTESGTRSKWITLANTFLISVLLLSALDLLVAFIRSDTISNYTISVLVDLTLTVLGLIFCSDLIVDQDQDSVTCFLAYMIFLWVCITVLKLVFVL